MANLSGWSSIDLCALRIGLLAASGAPAASSTGLWITNEMIELSYQLVLDQGVTFDQKTGCGDLCVTFQGRDKIKGVNLSLNLCVLDVEGIELMTGGTLVTSGGDSRGYVVPGPNDEIDREVSVEAWAKAWDGDQAATHSGDVLYHRYVFPRVTFTLGDGKLGHAVNTFPFTGHGKSNSNFGDGPANDLPWGAYVTPFGIWIDDDPLPSAAVGYQALVAS